MRRREGFEEANRSYPVREAVGGLLFLSTMTRPDIANAVRELSRYLENPTDKVVQGIKHLFRYLAGTTDFGLEYRFDRYMGADGFCDASYADDQFTRKSVSGILIRCNGTAVDWKSSLQPVVAQSTMESEYISMALIVNKMRVIRSIREWLFRKKEGPYPVYEDNEACELLAKRDGKSLKRAKHIDVRFHVVREAVEKGDIQVMRVSTDSQLADPLTKNLSSVIFWNHMSEILST